MSYDELFVLIIEKNKLIKKQTGQEEPELPSREEWEKVQAQDRRIEESKNGEDRGDKS